MQSSSTFIKVSGPIPEVKKKSGLINGWENIFAYWKEFVQNEALANKLGLFQIQLGGLEVQRIGKKYVLHWEFCIYHRSFDPEEV